MGIVYQAEDLERQAIVALKTLPKIDPSAIYQFKREFRLLAGITHPNLVTLYELFAQDDEWFMTMEFIDGVNFLAAVQSGEYPPMPTPSATGDEPTLTAPVESLDPRVIRERERPGDAEKLRRIAAQVVDGLSAIHAAGKLHCDIKPSNVLVTPEGRATILDFGLVAELDSAIGQHEGRRLKGTLAYMSPEQSAVDTLSPASDWYALGVMMFRALTGRLPFEGTQPEILEAKRTGIAPWASSLAEGIPPDLDELCAGLLARDPSRRPGAAELLRVLRGDRSTRAPAVETRSDFFVGRSLELATLHQALELARSGAALALAEGPSGVGKSALVQQFLKGAEAGGALVFAGRCYENEAVPFRAMDAVIDGVGNFLSQLSAGALESVRPADAGALAKAFPVLRLLPGFEPEPGDVFETRRRAFRALRELFVRLRSRVPLVVAIDDAQWGDADSAALLCEVLRQPEAPRMLLIVSFRPAAQSGEFLPPLVEFCQAQGIEAIPVPLKPLTPEDARALAQQLLGETGRRGSAEAIARESSGNPFFIQELAHHAGSGVAIDEAPTLERLLRTRVDQLPAEARGVLEVIAIAGRRISQADAFRAAGLHSLDPRIAVLLRSKNLVKGAGTGAEDWIETYHDRVRESVTASLDSRAAARHHLNLATTLIESGRGDDEMLAFHFEHAGEPLRAGRHYAAAAAHARAVTAFDRAAGQYARAVDLLAREPDIHSLRVQLAETLALAGRTFEAGQVYARCADETGGPEATALRREAGYHYLASGHIDEGRAVFRGLLAGTREELPKTQFGAIVRYLYYRKRIQWRGLEFRRRRPDEIPLDLAARADATYAVGTGLGMVDLALAMAPLEQSLLLALKAGDPVRTHRAMAMHAVSSHIGDKPLGAYPIQLLDTAEKLAEEVGTPAARALSKLSRAGALYSWCEFARAFPIAEEAERIFSQQCQGVAWELDTTRTFLIFSLSDLGRWADMWDRSQQYLEDAEQRGNLYLAVSLGVYAIPAAAMILKGPDESRKITRAYTRRWTQEGFHLQHLMSTNLLTTADMAEGNAQAAWDRLNEAWPRFRKAQMHRYPNIRIHWSDIRAQTALMLAERAADPRPYLRIAQKDARALMRERYPHGPAFGSNAAAALADQRGNREEAVALARGAIRRYEEIGMISRAAGMKLKLAQLVGGEEGSRLRAEVDAWAAREGVADLEVLLRLHTNGFRPR